MLRLIRLLDKKSVKNNPSLTYDEEAAGIVYTSEQNNNGSPHSLFVPRQNIYSLKKRLEGHVSTIIAKFQELNHLEQIKTVASNWISLPELKSQDIYHLDALKVLIEAWLANEKKSQCRKKTKYSILLIIFTIAISTLLTGLDQYNMSSERKVWTRSNNPPFYNDGSNALFFITLMLLFGPALYIESKILNTENASVISAKFIISEIEAAKVLQNKYQELIKVQPTVSPINNDFDWVKDHVENLVLTNLIIKYK